MQFTWNSIQANHCLLLHTACATLLFTTSAFAAAADPRPNVLVIMTDDQGSGDIGYNNPLVNTPALDRVANESAVFSNFIVAPACTPSRASFLTGRNYLSTGVWGVGPRGYIHRDEVFLPEFLGRAGYRTAHFGKWGEGWTPDQRPYMRGYDVVAAMGAYQHRDPWLDHNGTLRQEKGWTTDILADHTIDFIREQTQAGKSWYAITAYISPHEPLECDTQYSAPYLAKGYSKELSTFWGMIQQMDEATGRILAELDKLKIADNTIVIFLSDNGPTPSIGSQGKTVEEALGGKDWALRNPLLLRGHKSLVWENALRVPFFLRWPKHVPPGVRQQTASVEDLLPTILDLAGIPSSIRADHLPLDGQSFKKVLFQPDAPATERLIFTMPVAYEGTAPSWPKLIIENPQDMRYEQVHTVVYGSRFKYHHMPRGEEALYDIKADPRETTDVSTYYPEVFQEMAAACRNYWDQLLQSNRGFRMPSFLIGDSRYEKMDRCWAYLPPDVIPGNAAQEVTGTVTCPFQGATGFMQPGDTATYAMDVRTAGTYRIAIKGRDLDVCGPIEIKLAGARLHPAAIHAQHLDFGTVELKSGESLLTVSASDAGTQKGVILEIAVSPEKKL